MSTLTEVSREEALALCSEPAPDDYVVRPYEPGPEYEDRARVVVKLVDADSQIGRIVVPDSARRHTGEAIIIDTGQGAWDPEEKRYKPLVNLRVGDRIVLGKYVGIQFEVTREVMDEDGTPRRVVERFQSVNVKDIMAIFRPL